MPMTLVQHSRVGWIKEVFIQRRWNCVVGMCNKIYCPTVQFYGEKNEKRVHLYAVTNVDKQV